MSAGAILDAAFVGAVTFRLALLVSAGAEARGLPGGALFEALGGSGSRGHEQGVAGVHHRDALLHRSSAAGHERYGDCQQGPSIQAHD